LTDASKLKEGDAITFHDGSEGSEEQVYLNGKNGNTFTSCGRGLNGTTAVSHTSGAQVILGGNNLTINGADTIYRDIEILNSDPVRTSPVANAQNAPHLRGEGVWQAGPRTKLINLVIHDCQEGIFTTPKAVDGEIYGCIVYNNGYEAGNTANGHGLYIQNGLSSKSIVNTIAFNNFSIGFKAVS